MKFSMKIMPALFRSSHIHYLMCPGGKGNQIMMLMMRFEHVCSFNSASHLVGIVLGHGVIAPLLLPPCIYTISVMVDLNHVKNVILQSFATRKL
jgi:hypothetical protein